MTTEIALLYKKLYTCSFCLVQNQASVHSYQIHVVDINIRKEVMPINMKISKEVIP